MRVQTRVKLSEAELAVPVESLKVTCIQTLGKLEAIETEWNGLFQRARINSAFLSFPWMMTWWKHFGQRAQLHVLAVRNPKGKLVGLAPFYVKSVICGGLPFHRLGLLADTHVGSDHLDLLAEPELQVKVAEAVALQLQLVDKQWSFAEFANIKGEGTINLFLSYLTGSGAVADRVVKSTCYHIPLPNRFETYLASVSGHLRRDFHRRWRVLSGLGDIDFITMSTPSEVEQHFPDLLRLHAKRFDFKDTASAIFEPGVVEFHRDAVQALSRAGYVRLAMLRAKGVSIAGLYGFQCGDTFQYYQSGLDTDWYSYGLGKVMMGKGIEWAIKLDCADFDLLRGTEEYKTLWAQHSRQTYTAQIFEDSMAGRLVHGIKKGREVGRDAARSLQHRWNSMRVAPSQEIISGESKSEIATRSIHRPSEGREQ